jgi:F-type H+-transporting ATPase subunit delta
MKTEYQTIAHQYAEAILELALQNGDVQLAEKVFADLTNVNKTVESDRELKLVLEHPSLPAAEKKNILKQLFAKHIDDLTLRLLELVTDRGRVAILPAIEARFKALLNIKQNIVTASLTSASQLSDAEVSKIKKKLSDSLNKTLELDVKVDESLIAGAILRLGDQVIDGSVKGKLASLERVFASV